MPFTNNIQVVQHASASHSYTSGTGTGATYAAFANAVAPGNCVVAVVSVTGLNLSANLTGVFSGNSQLADNWQSGINQAQGTNVATWTYVNPNSVGGYSRVYVNQVTFGYSATTSNGPTFFLDIYELSGVALSSLIDQSSSGTAANSGTWDSGASGATTYPYEIYIGGVVTKAAPQNTTLTVTPPGSWTNSALLHQAGQRGTSVIHSYQETGYKIVSSSGQTAEYNGSNNPNGYSAATVLTLFGTTLFGSDSDSFRNQGETASVNATLSSSDSFANQGESATVNATIVDSDAFANQGETNNVLIIITDSDSFVNTGETAIAPIGIQSKDTGKFTENHNLLQFAVTSPFPLFFYPWVPKPVVAPIYMGHPRNSAVAPVSWQTLQTTATRKATSWRVTQQQITSLKAIAWNNRFRVEVTKLYYAPGLPRPVVNPIDWYFRPNTIEWRNDGRRSAFTQAKFRVMQRITPLLAPDVTANWNVLIRTTVQQQTSFNVRNKVTAPVITVAYESGWAGLPRPIVYPIDPGPGQNASTKIQWRLNSRRSATKKTSWMVRIPVKAQKAIAFVDNGILVSPTKQITWMLRKKVTATVASSFRDVVRRYSQKRTTWQTENRITTAQKAVAFRVRNKVTTQSPAIQWYQVAHVIARKRITWFDRLPISPRLRITWKTNYRFGATPIIPTLVYGGRVPDQIVHPLGSMSGFAPNKRILWHLPILHVVAQSPTGNPGTTTITWNTRKRLSATQRTTWNTIGRKSVQQPTVFHVVIAVSPQVIIKWNVGLVFSERMHVSAQNREDFAY